MANIHPTAIVEDGAEVGSDVEIGPYCVVGGNVRLADNVKLHSHVAVAGKTSIGAGTEIFPFASIGHIPQDKKFRGEDVSLEVGEGNVIREHVTMNPGTADGGNLTKVGNNGLFMMGSHVAHDCEVGNDVILANNATLAGHCKVGDSVILGGLAAVHQFVRLGAYSFVGGMSGVENDVIPFGMVLGNRAYLNGLNILGLKRNGFDREQIHNLRKGYRMLFSNEGTLKERLEDVEKMFAGDPCVEQVAAFIHADSSRQLCVPKSGD
ncbi:MAG: acyl-ACP--UDP-N-acetylglucosamine O-acyltransferase [Methyloligellaceae bacterium]